MARYHGDVECGRHELGLILADAEDTHDVGDRYVNDAAGDDHYKRGRHPGRSDEDTI